MLGDERQNGFLEDSEKYLEDDFEVEPHTPPMIEPWRISEASVELCCEIAKTAELLAKLADRLRSLYV